jgi:hypothetical protein
VLAYLVPVVTAHRDDLGRTPDPALTGVAAPADAGEADGERPLVDVPPARPAPGIS